MIKKDLICKILLLAVGLLFSTLPLISATRYSVASGNWNLTSTWSATSGGAPGASFPVAGDIVYIENGHTVTVTVDAACASITFTGVSATLTVNSSIVLNISGNVTLNKQPNANATCTLSGAGSLSCLNIAVGSTLPGSITNFTTRTHIFTSTISNLSVSGSLTIYSYYGVNTRVRNGSFNLENGTLSIGGSITTSNQNAVNISTFSMATGAQSGTLILAGATPFNLSGTGTNTITLNGTSSLVNYNFAGAQTTLGTIYTNLTLSGSGAKTVTGTTINGILSMEGTATAGGTASAFGANATLQYKGSASQTTGIEFPATFSGTGGVIVNNTAGVNLAGSVTISNNLALTNGAFAVGANALTLSNGANLNYGAGSLTGGATSNLTIGTGTDITLNAITGGLNNFNTSRNIILGSSLSVNGTLTLTAGTFAVGANTLTLNGPTIAGTPTNLTTTSSSSLVFGGTSAGVSIPSSVVALSGLSITNTSVVTLQSSLAVSGTFNPTGAGLSIGANTLTLNGQINCGTLIGGATSNLIIGGAGTASLAGVTLNNLTINRAVSLCGNVTIGGTLTLTSGTFTVGANTLALNGPAIAGTPSNLSTSSSSSLIFGGSSSGVSIPSSVANLNNLTINNANGVTLAGGVVVSNSLTMTQGNIISASNTLTLSNSTSGNLAYTSGTITGKFQRAIGLPTGTQYLFPVGTSADYNPLKITFNNLTAGQLAVQFLTNDIGSTGLPLNDAGTEIFDRQTTGYWTLTAVAPMASTNYNLNLNYTGFSGVDALARIVKRTNGGNLALDGTHGTVSSPEITRTGLSGISTSTTDFAIGKPNPRFTTQPSDYSGCNATFNVIVSGKTPLTYQWQENNGGGFSNITNGGIYSGATSTSLSISGATVSMNGYLYRCIVTDALGYNSTSTSATLTVSLPAVTLGYNYSSDITIDPASGSADLTDFPALISFTTSPDRDRLRTIANGGHVSSSNGYDIIFTDQNGNKLDHQIESYNAATGQ